MALFLVSSFTLPANVEASNTPTRSGVWASVPAPFSVGVWASPHSASVSDDVATTTTIGLGVGIYTDYLWGEGFGFYVPAGSTINGITVSVKRKANYASEILDRYVQLVKGDVISGNNKASGTYWGTSYATVTYGGSSDLWGLALTSADVNASNFGFVIAAYNNGVDDVLCSIDYINMTVYFTAPNPVAPTLALPGNTSYADQFVNTFAWTESSSSISYFHIQVSTVKSFSSTSLNTTSLSTAYAWALGTPLSQQAYYWRVRAVSTYNTISSWSGIFQFYPTSTLYLNLNYGGLDGWGLPFTFPRTFINGTQYSATPVALPNGVFKHWNLTVTDWFSNIVYQGLFLANVTPTTLNVQLQLVSTTLQSYGLTNAEIFGNVTMSDTFNLADGSPPDPVKWTSAGAVATASIVGGRLALVTGVAGWVDCWTTPVLSSVRITENFWVKTTSAAVTSIIFQGWSIAAVFYTQWWYLQDNGAGTWSLYTRLGGAVNWRMDAGTYAINTWYRFQIIMTLASITANIYNPDGSLNGQLIAGYDTPISSNWRFYLGNYAASCTTLYDLFVLQGTVGYSKTLTFYDSDNTLLMPDDYVFNGTAWNGAIRFQTSATISLTLNRVIQLTSDPHSIVYITYKNQAGHTLKWDEFNTTIYTPSLGWLKLGTENSITMLTSESITVMIRGLFGTLISNATYSYPGIRLIIQIPVYSITVANNDEVHASYVSFYPTWLNSTQYTYPVNDSKWILKTDKEWSILAGNYTLRVYYPLLGPSGTMIFYNLTITEDYGMYVTNNATVDLYTAYGNLGAAITALRVDVIDRYVAIANQYTSIEAKEKILQDLNNAISTDVGGVANIQFYEFILMCAVGLGVLVTFITIAVKGRPKINFGPPYRHT